MAGEWNIKVSEPRGGKGYRYHGDIRRRQRKAGGDSRIMEVTGTKIRILNRDVIKYIAMFTMLLNHISHMFMTTGSVEALVFEYIGYFTAPTMCYFLVEGYAHTRSVKRYGQRLLVFAVISQIPFALAFQFGNLNMIYTLLCCFLLLVVMEKVWRPFPRTVLCICLTLATAVGDWPLVAPVFTILFYNSKGERSRLARSYAVGYAFFAFLMIQTYCMGYDYTLSKAVAFGLLSGTGILVSAVVILFFYNGERAERGRGFSKWFFYLFYPGHLLALYLIKRLMGGL